MRSTLKQWGNRITIGGATTVTRTKGYRNVTNIIRNQLILQFIVHLYQSPSIRKLSLYSSKLGIPLTGFRNHKVYLVQYEKIQEAYSVTSRLIIWYKTKTSSSLDYENQPDIERLHDASIRGEYDLTSIPRIEFLDGVQCGVAPYIGCCCLDREITELSGDTEKSYGELK